MLILYNFNNKLIESSDIINIAMKLNINDLNITDITLYQKAYDAINLIVNFQL